MARQGPIPGQPGGVTDPRALRSPGVLGVIGCPLVGALDGHPHNAIPMTLEVLGPFKSLGSHHTTTTYVKHLGVHHAAT